MRMIGWYAGSGDHLNGATVEICGVVVLCSSVAGNWIMYRLWLEDEWWYVGMASWVL